MSLRPHAWLRAAPIRSALGIMLILSVLAPPAMAHGWHHHHRHRNNGNDRPPIEAPEIDPGSMLGGLTLLIGGAFILADRRRRTQLQVGLD